MTEMVDFENQRRPCLLPELGETVTFDPPFRSMDNPLAPMETKAIIRNKRQLFANIFFDQ